MSHVLPELFSLPPPSEACQILGAETLKDLYHSLEQHCRSYLHKKYLTVKETFLGKCVLGERGGGQRERGGAERDRRAERERERERQEGRERERGGGRERQEGRERERGGGERERGGERETREGGNGGKS